MAEAQQASAPATAPSSQAAETPLWLKGAGVFVIVAMAGALVYTVGIVLANWNRIGV